MKLLRIGDPGREVPAIMDGAGTLFDLRSLTQDIDGEFLGQDGIDRAVAALRLQQLDRLEVADTDRCGAPIARPGQIVCVGANYREHIREVNAQVPTEPIIFMKSPYTMIGPNDRVLVPRASRKTDWEVELAVVIGRTARYLASPEQSAACIAGFAVANDLSEREFQLERGGQWDKGKSCETFNPLGPWLVPVDVVADVQDLRLRLWINGELRQDSSTADMLFSVAHIVWYLSQFMVLHPGDVINTGTPQGVAQGSPDPQYLKAGDVIDVEIDGLGHQRQQVEQA